MPEIITEVESEYLPLYCPDRYGFSDHDMLVASALVAFDTADFSNIHFEEIVPNARVNGIIIATEMQTSLLLGNLVRKPSLEATANADVLRKPKALLLPKAKTEISGLII